MPWAACPVVMHELNELGLLDESAITCMGPLPEYIVNCTKPADGEVCRKHDNPFSKVGALRVLHGNIAPDGGIVKKSAVDPSMLTHTGPAVASIARKRLVRRFSLAKLSRRRGRYSLRGPEGRPGHA